MNKNTRITLAYLLGAVQVLIIYFISDLNIKPDIAELIIFLILGILCGTALYKITKSGEA